MASIYDIKPAFQRFLRPCAGMLARNRITPNQVTLSAVVLSFAGGLIFWKGQEQPWFLLLIPVILFARMGLNAIDGMLARDYNQSSALGEILNEVGDIFSDTVLYLPLMRFFSTSIETLMCIALFLVLACLSEFCGILAKTMVGVRRYDGPMGKSDRAFCMGLLAVALYVSPGHVVPFSLIIFSGLNALLVLSCVNRLKFILQHLRSQESL